VRNIIVLIVLIACLTSSCDRKRIEDPKEYFKWINNPDHHLVVTKNVNDVELIVKYLPPEYMAYRELSGQKKFSEKERDSLINYYSMSKTFLLTINSKGEGKQKPSDIMFRGIDKYQDYKERSFEMNFSMEDFVSLVTDKGTYKPVLNTLENTYGLSSSRTILFVFADSNKGRDLNNAKELDFLFEDEFFSTGVHHFEFEKDDLDNIPYFIFTK
jgi:hypothetical protein